MSDLEARVMTLHHNGRVWVTAEDDFELETKLGEWKAQQHYTYIGRDGKAVLARDLEDRAEAAEAMVEKLAEALSLADASLSGANMDMKHVWRKIKSALAAYQAQKGAK